MLIKCQGISQNIFKIIVTKLKIPDDPFFGFLVSAFG